jgi:hypothetical protein
MEDFVRPDDDSPRPNLANMLSVSEMISLYEKVLSELDSAISTQRNFAIGSSGPDLPRNRTNDVVDK